MTSRTGRSRWVGALCGLLTAAVALGIAQLLAGLTIPNASPILVVGSVVVNHTPLGVKEWATSFFRTGDKTALEWGVLILVLLYSMVVGTLAMRRLWAGFAGLALFAVIGTVAALTRHDAYWAYAAPTILGLLAGMFALYRLILAGRAWTDAAAAARAPSTWTPITFGKTELTGPDDTGLPAHEELRAPDLPGRGGGAAARAPSGAMRAGPGGPNTPLQYGPGGTTARRTFIVTAGVTAAAAAIGEVGGRSVATRKNVSAARAAVRLPQAVTTVKPLPAGVNLKVPGISPFITPNGSFYRVDTALLVPQVDPANWKLRIHGMVEREVVITFDELLKRPLMEDYITICCVSDPVQGPYIGNAKWLGASYGALIRDARPLRGADQLLCTSVDGFTSGTPLATVLDAGRDSLIAVAMNGAALPTEHGFPARLVVPGLYGYVSATKWVVDIEVTTFAKAQGYWVPLGWSQQAPIKTESRIDVPSLGASVKAGQVAVAGVAWAQHKGIETVEVRIDKGPWQPATLALVPGLDTWQQWVYQWDATAGQHVIEARATDKTGYTQTSVMEPVAPNGASGYPITQVTVS